MKDLKFIAAMCSYGILALLAGFTLEGRIRIAVWILIGGITIKTLLVVLKRRLD
jgi:hypothetical protein